MKTPRCKHLNIRCVHGDGIIYRGDTARVRVLEHTIKEIDAELSLHQAKLDNH